MLTGQAKIDYQREYMRRYRSNKKQLIPLDPVRPLSAPVLDPVKAQPVLRNEPDIATRNQSVRERMESMSIADIEAEFGHVPNWRREQEVTE